jgi:hypothetical protein
MPFWFWLASWIAIAGLFAFLFGLFASFAEAGEYQRRVEREALEHRLHTVIAKEGAD